MLDEKLSILRQKGKTTFSLFYQSTKLHFRHNAGAKTRSLGSRRRGFQKGLDGTPQEAVGTGLEHAEEEPVL